MTYLYKYKYLTTLLLTCMLYMPALSQEVTLTISHFISPKAPPHTKFIEPWARAIEQQSNGKITFKIFPSMALGGTPPQLYHQVRDGTADIIWTVIGYNAGVFPRAEVFELPSVHYNSAYATTMAIQDNIDVIKQDFSDIHPILIHAHGGNALHLTDGCLNNNDAMHNLKLRTPSRSGGWYIDSLGGQAVGMPLPSLPQALAKHNVDGALLPFEVFPAYKIHTLTTCSMTLPNNERFGTAVFMLAMNKDSYNSLSDELKNIIDNNSGLNIAADIGKLWDNTEKFGQTLQEKSGSPVQETSANLTKFMQTQADSVANQWLIEAKKAGIDNAHQILRKAQQSVKQYTNR